MEDTHRKLKATKASIQQRYIKAKREEELRHRFIVSISGYDPQTGLGKNCVRMLPTEQFLKLIENLSYDSNVKLRQVEIQLNQGKEAMDYGSMQMGASACVPIPLLVNILRDLKDQHGTVLRMGWKTIAKKDFEKRGVGKYCMFHWERGSSYSGYIEDWKCHNELLGLKSQELVDDFACQILKNFRPDQARKQHKELLQKFAVFPGCVMTESAYDQRAHLDTSSWGIIVHMPLCEEGLMIYIWPEDYSRTNAGKYIHVPFGSFLALPAHSVHSGVYGNSGNIRFHMTIRERDNIWMVDKLIDDDVINKKGAKRNNWRSELKKRLGTSVSIFTKQYIDTIRKKCGSVFCEEWTKNISLK